MPGYSAEQIYGFARSAGFSPDQSATMTAIALAESGGNSRAHNSTGEDSRGLWQINVNAHPDLAARFDLYDPGQNARAAFAVSGHGRDVEAWTTTHGGLHASYLRYRGEAEAGAMSAGDGAHRGVWTGTSAYGDPLSPGPGGAGEVAAAATPLGQTDASDASVSEFLRAAVAQRGDRYYFGAEARLTDPNPSTFDCSELTQWAAAQAGVVIPDGASNQFLWAKEHGYLVPVSQAREVPGALLFEFSTEPTPGGGRPSEAHVAISLGHDQTIEARGTSYGVNEFASDNRGFNYAAVIPGLAAPGMDASAWASPAGAVDSDLDSIDDQTEAMLGLDPFSGDTDTDGLSDAYELQVSHTDPRLADSDADGMSDAFEIAHGTDPMQPDTLAGASLDGSLATAAATDVSRDTDLDGLDDSLEQILGTDAQATDSDLDGYADGLEYHAGSDSLSATSTPLHPGEDPQHLDDSHPDHLLDGH